MHAEFCCGLAMPAKLSYVLNHNSRIPKQKGRFLLETSHHITSKRQIWRLVFRPSLRLRYAYFIAHMQYYVGEGSPLACIWTHASKERNETLTHRMHACMASDVASGTNCSEIEEGDTYSCDSACTALRCLVLFQRKPGRPRASAA